MITGVIGRTGRTGPLARLDAPTVIMTVPAGATAETPFSASAAATSAITQALYLGVDESITLAKTLPYSVTVYYADGTSARFVQTVEQLTLTDQPPILSMLLADERIDFTEDTTGNFTLIGGSFVPRFTYAWTVVQGDATLSATDTQTVEVTPNAVGPVELAVVVSDGTQPSEEAARTVSVSSPIMEALPRSINRVNLRQVPTAINMEARRAYLQTEVLRRVIYIGKTLNITADLTGNLLDPIITATAQSANGLATIGETYLVGSVLVIPITGLAEGADAIVIDYASETETDCQQFIIDVRPC